MRFMNFKIEPARLAAALAAAHRTFSGSGIPGSFEDHALRVIAARLREKPGRYREFGPYWWAVKAALAEAGYAVTDGDRGDPVVAAEYCGTTVAETLVAAEMFKDMNRATYFVGHSSWRLNDEDPAEYELLDEDMEVMVPMAR
jgi:hypothetical protein